MGFLRIEAQRFIEHKSIIKKTVINFKILFNRYKLILKKMQDNKSTYSIIKQRRRRQKKEKKYSGAVIRQQSPVQYRNLSTMFSAMNAASERNYLNYLQRKQKMKQQNKEKKMSVEKEKREQQLAVDKNKIQKKLAQQQEFVRSLVDFTTKKEIENHLEKGYQSSKTRVKAKDKVLFQRNAPYFFNFILKHHYGEKESKLQRNKIPDNFIDLQTYKSTFHYLIMSQCVAEIRYKLIKIQKQVPQSLKIQIRQTLVDQDGYVELYLQQKEIQKNGGIELKSYSLSRNRLGLICSSREYRKEYYGTTPTKNKKQFAFVVLLETPTSNDELRKVKAKTKVKACDLQEIRAARQSQTLYFFDLQKISTNLREYLAVTNINCSDLVQQILNPSLAEAESHFVKNKEVLDSILSHLKGIYNETQWLSIKEMVLRQRGFVLLQGPPGTGKTSTLMGLLAAQYQYLRKTQDKRKIMICAPSNAAVDHIARRIINQGLLTGEGKIVHPTILRTGIVETMDPIVRAVSLDDQCEKIMLTGRNLSQMSTPQIKEKIIQIQKQISRLSSNTNEKNEIAAKKQQIIQLQRQLYEFKRIKYITSKANYTNIQNKLFSAAEIVLTTLSSSGNDKIDKIRGEIACLIVDEAAQATQPNLLIALQTGVEKVLLIGDPQQLPATCISKDSNITLFNRSLFERFLDAKIKPYFLNIQYRMSPAIRAFPSSRFYQGRLIDADIVKQRPIPQSLKNFQNRNVLFIDLKYGRQEIKEDSYCNRAEAKVISLLIKYLMDTSVTLGIITPYQSQKKVIYRDCMDALRRNTVDQQYLQKQIMINTVDSFQGQEKDVIIVSTVRANQQCSVGFLTDERRVNVTLTRAKHLLIVIGHANTLGSNEVWDDFLTWTEKKNCLYQITSERNAYNDVKDVLNKFSFQQIRRKKHSKLSTDIRKIYAKKAIKIQSSQTLLQEKRKRQEDELNFQQVLARMKKFQEQNLDFLK